MKPYSIFAKYYDLLTEDVDYARRAEYLISVFKHHQVEPKIVLDLACGTGSLTIELVKAGYDVIGVDRSEEMLACATQKTGLVTEKAMFICQDIRKLDLYGTIDAVVCSLDGINHLTNLSDVMATFGRVSLFLIPGGIFIFDLNSPYKISTVFGNNTFIYDYEDIYCIWQNSYNEKTALCCFDMTFFEHQGGESFIRYDEHFAERAYTVRQIENMLKKSGLQLVAVYDDLSFENPAITSERIIIVAKKDKA